MRGASGCFTFSSRRSLRVPGEIQVTLSPWKVRVLFSGFSAILKSSGGNMRSWVGSKGWNSSFINNSVEMSLLLPCEKESFSPWSKQHFPVPFCWQPFDSTQNVLPLSRIGRYPVQRQRLPNQKRSMILSRIYFYWFLLKVKTDPGLFFFSFFFFRVLNIFQTVRCFFFSLLRILSFPPPEFQFCSLS